MKLLVAGVRRISGKSKKSPQVDYDIVRLLVMTPIKPRSGVDYSIAGAGWELQEISCDPAAYSQFMGLKYPCEVFVDTDVRSRGRSLDVCVVGLRKTASVS